LGPFSTPGAELEPARACARAILSQAIPLSGCVTVPPYSRVTAYIRQEEGAANSTTMRDVACLRRMFSLAVQAGRLPSKPYIPTVDVQNVREGFFTSDELNRIVEEIREPLQPVVRFLALTG
jgi:hypothetical protein